MKKFLIFGLFLIVSTYQTKAYGVYSIAEDEVKSAQPVQFQDYTGRPKIINTREQVRNIGRFLADAPDNQVMNYVDKYSVRRVRSDSEQAYSADIFSLLENARANKIRDIRSMISGFLQSAYGYSTNDALALAVFITYYNALYRNNLDYVKTKYDPKVLQFISEEKVGLAKNYRSWAGKTQILIPLSNNLGVADVMELGNSNVQDSLKKEPGKGVEEREAINNMQNNQLQAEKQALQEQFQALDDQETLLEAKQKKLEQELENAKTPEEKEKIQAELNKNQEEQRKVAQEKEDLEEKQKIIAQQEKQVQEAKKEIEQDRQETAVQNNSVSSDKPQEKKPTLAQVLQETNKQKSEVMQSERTDGDFVYYLKKVGYYNGPYKDSQLAMIDAKSNKLSLVSQLATISGNQFDIISNGVVVIARENPKSQLSHLALLNKKSLDIVTVGEESIYAPGIIRVEDDLIYGIFQKENDENFLGVFDSSLKLLHSSSVVVDKDTFITLFQNKVYISQENGKIIALLKKDLSTDSEILE